ncbi:Gfo/Idh/MocA family protein [Pseudohongiella sp. O18]|uniref:Gfo/Idh/MocA family protein n=1 Tax=Pseudohongiella sp. O18 TaxID=2904248 RepID=UPI001F3AFB4C|nr:Gfo/Idh/MocA family oxidoreductase [Pseudohongiella sp. O18]
MSKARLRFFENSVNQRHITDADRYLYRQDPPRYKLVVIGTGTMGQEHMRVAALLGRASVLGIYDAHTHSMDAAEQAYRLISSEPLRRYDSLESACNDPEADVLMICTPNHTHLDVLKTVLASGKPIFLEKPMATTLADAAALMEAAQSHSAFVQIGLQYRYKAQYREAFHEVQARHSLGRVHTISMSEYRPPFLDKVGQWNKFNRNTGGTLVEKCCHYFDLINLMADSTAVRVYASGGQAVNFLDFKKAGESADIDDHAFVCIDYANGVRASFTLNMFCPDFTEEMIVVGEQGRLITSERFDFHAQVPTQTSINVELGENGASRRTELSYPKLIEQSGHHGATYYEHIALMDQLDGKAADCATVEQGLWSMIVASAAQASMASGLAINIEHFLQEQHLQHFMTGNSK